METNSRTAKSIKNSMVAMGFYFVNLVLQFFSRKIFLEYLGTEILGLNTTASNLLQFINLAELGVGAAIACTLYKPLFDGDKETISEIITLQGKLYRNIAYFMIGAATILSCFFPWIFEKMELPLWYAYASFGVLLFSSLLSYFCNYKQVLLSADQKDYKIQYSYKLSMGVMLIAQVFAIRYLTNGYLWWLILQCLFAVIASIALNVVIKNTYPYLKHSRLSFKELRLKYPTIVIQTKQLFFHKIAGFALTQTSPMIIYAYTTLTVVALYGNYMLIVMGIISFMAAVFNSISGGIGNLLAEGNKVQILAVFKEMFSLRFFLSIICCFEVFILTPPFISLWLGEEYLLPQSTLTILTGILFINLSRHTVETYLYAAGLFKDIWAPISEAIINISLSIFLGYFFGLNGILLGVLISLIIVVFFWKPFFLFHYGLKEKTIIYIKLYLKHLLTSMFVFLLSLHAVKFIYITPSESMGMLLVYFFITIIPFSIILGGGMFIFRCDIIRIPQRFRIY